jgi:N-methylhydantoinase A/oxoprolinase/acetone carboxylase beta subunit
VRKRVGVDAGGTFTDLVNPDGSIAKVLSTPDDPARAVLAAIAKGGLVEEVAHATTLATNALLEGRGSPVALYTYDGRFELRQIATPGVTSPDDPLEALVPRDLCFHVPARENDQGADDEPRPVPDPPAGVAAAIVLHDADDNRNAADEQAVAASLRRRGLEVTASSEISTELPECQRTIVTVVNASLLAPCRRSLLRLAEVAERVMVMNSAGDLIALEEAARLPVSLFLSSAAGGVLAAAAAAVAAGFPDAVTLDMGGTSTDVCLILGGRPSLSSQHLVAGLPIALPGLDIRTIGAGGGSIVRTNDTGALVIGPDSAGADPGPACYGRGGTRPTVTDANLVAGRIPPDTRLPGIGRLDVEAAREALAKGDIGAESVLAGVNATMADAVRHFAVAPGVDLRALALVAYGGAGPLHACELADALGLATVVIPTRAGVLSAVGVLAATRQVDVVQTWNDLTDYRAAEFGLASLAWVARSQLGSEGVNAFVEQLYDCRYAGHCDVLSTRSIPAFHAEHRRRFGSALSDTPVEVVGLRASARQRSPISLADLPDPGGRVGQVTAPSAIAEPDCTLWVAEGWQAAVGGGGAWVLRRNASF